LAPVPTTYDLLPITWRARGPRTVISLRSADETVSRVSGHLLIRGDHGL